MDPQILREAVYHATMCDLVLPQLSFQVLDLHYTRIRTEDEEAEKARKAQDAHDERERKKLVNFDHHYRQIDDWLSNDPIDRKSCCVAWVSTRTKFDRESPKLTAKAAEPNTNFLSKCNALETLRKTAEATVANERGSGVGCNIYPLLPTDECVKHSMLTVPGTMTTSERTDLRRAAFQGMLCTEKMKALTALCQIRKVRMVRVIILFLNRAKCWT